jgi:hypothetical protein
VIQALDDVAAGPVTLPWIRISANEIWIGSPLGVLGRVKSGEALHEDGEEGRGKREEYCPIGSLREQSQSLR